ncbi:hypothetical protein [Corallococcus sp. 4LFB]|uniref:hypothetical protein n=1 Tax=Corallococcus sp. 4LFB TaxID=3383249 RepID=UPI003976E55D
MVYVGAGVVVGASGGGSKTLTMEDAAREDAPEALPLDVVLTGGRVVRVPARFDAQALRWRVVALEGTEP